MSKTIVLLILISFISFTFFAEVSEGVKEISYGAIGENHIPCDRKSGNNVKCHLGEPETSYQRGCSPLTRCRGPQP
uniref:Rapid ALkalinization Factor n=1 Tax=Solanum tuberosum TaxID=4113 RepID=M1BRH8_SOLTU